MILSTFQKICISLLCFVALIAFIFSLVKLKPEESAPLELSVNESVIPDSPRVEKAAIEPVKEEAPKKLPKEFSATVPFTPQAPTANWDTLHEEACEEASVIMVNAFFQDDTRKILPPTEVEKEIQKLTDWQIENFGYSLSIDAQEAARMIESVYQLHAELMYDVSEDMIKGALAHGKLVIVPVNGRALGNPNFTPPGPIYHMFVITGYTETMFVVNDPGTKRGQNYLYSYTTLRQALGDYDHQTKKTDSSKPVLILVSRK